MKNYLLVGTWKGGVLFMALTSFLHHQRSNALTNTPAGRLTISRSPIRTVQYTTGPLFALKQLKKNAENDHDDDESMSSSSSEARHKSMTIPKAKPATTAVPSMMIATTAATLALLTALMASPIMQQTPSATAAETGGRMGGTFAAPAPPSSKVAVPENYYRRGYSQGYQSGYRRGSITRPSPPGYSYYYSPPRIIYGSPFGLSSPYFYNRPYYYPSISPFARPSIMPRPYFGFGFSKTWTF